LGLGQQHPREHKVVALPQVGDLVVRGQAALPRPAGGLIDAALGQQQPRPFGVGREPQGGDVRARIDPAGFVHGLQGGIRVAPGLVDPAQRHQRHVQLGQLDHLPAEFDALGGVLEALIQLVALVEHLGDPHVGLAGVVDRKVAVLSGPMETFAVGAQGRLQLALHLLHEAEHVARRQQGIGGGRRPGFGQQRGEGRFGVRHAAVHPVGNHQQPTGEQARAMLLLGDPG
jgi:hypothetical protein